MFNKKILSVIIILSLIFSSCKKDMKNEEKTTIKNKVKETNLTFDNFLFFKKNMTSTEVLELLKQKKIIHEQLKKSKKYGFTKVKTLKINTLKIINEKINDVIVTFVNDTIAKLSYVKNSEIYNEYNKIDAFNKIIREDNLFFEEVFKALTEKYGFPKNSKYFGDDSYKADDMGITPSVEIYEFEMDFFNEYKMIDFSHKLLWQSKKEVEIELDRYYSCDGHFKNERFTTLDLLYNSYFTVYFEKTKYENSQKIHDKLIKEDFIKANDIEKQNRKKELDKI
jgi:hypothetical protein